MLGFLSRFVDSNDRELKRIQPYVDAATELLTHTYSLERVAEPLAMAAGLADPDDRLLKAVIRP